MRTATLTLTATLIGGLCAPAVLAQTTAAPPAGAETPPAPVPPPEPTPAPEPEAAAGAGPLASAAPAAAAAIGPVAQVSTVTTAPAPAAEVRATPPAARPPGLVEALIGGKVSASLRYRYEYLDREDTPLHSRLSTMRLALGYETKPFHGLSVFGEFEGVAAIGSNDWKVPTNDAAYKHNLMGENANRPVAADPVGNEVNQAMLKYTSPWLTVKLGRQNVALNNARFISFSPWRQANQTLDAANVEVTPLKGLAINYLFINQANRTIGHDALDGQLKMSTHVANVTYKRPGIVNLAAFNLYLDYRDLPVLVTATGAPLINMMTGMPTRLADGSSNSTGVRIDGPYKIDDAWGILYALDFAHQRDVAGNPLKVRANYYGAELGLAYKGFGLRGQYNVRQGTSDFATGEAFQTPLSHPWDGWTENFLRTPKMGLRIAAAHLAGPIPGVDGLTFTSAYYEYFAERTGKLSATSPEFQAGDHYGREVDAGLEYRFVGLDKNWLVGARFAYYDEDKLKPVQVPIGAANLRTSAYTMYSF